MDNNILVKGGTLFDGTGRDIIENAAVVIEDGKFVYVGTVDSEDMPKDFDADIEIIDATGKMILPGLIESHTHISMDGTYSKHPAIMALEMDRLELMMRSIPWLQRTLRNGFTTVRDGGSGWGWIECALRDAFERGDVEGPRYLATGYHLTVEGGHACFMPYHLAKKGIEEMAGMYCNGVEEWRKAARTNIWNGVDAIKVVASRAYMTASKHYDATTAQATVEEMHAAVEEARKVNIPVISHANGKEAIMNSIEAGVDIIVHGYYMDEKCASLMEKKGIYWEPTNAESRNCYWSACGLLPERLTREEPYYPDMHDPAKSKGNIANWEDKVKNFKKIIDNTGVKVLTGSDAGCPWVIHGLNAQEMEASVMLGMSTKQALLASTRTAAESMGLYDVIGSVEVGKCADLVVVDGDPFKDISILQDEDKINVVLKDGKHITSR